jgi:hypothetical protein
MSTLPTSSSNKPVSVSITTCSRLPSGAPTDQPSSPSAVEAETGRTRRADMNGRLQPPTPPAQWFCLTVRRIQPAMTVGRRGRVLGLGVVTSQRLYNDWCNAIHTAACLATGSNTIFQREFTTQHDLLLPL